jgi:hypothetical protein
LQRRRKKGHVPPGNPNPEVKFLGTCIAPKALKKTLLQLSSSKKGILLGFFLGVYESKNSKHMMEYSGIFMMESYGVDFSHLLSQKFQLGTMPVRRY